MIFFFKIVKKATKAYKATTLAALCVLKRQISKIRWTFLIEMHRNFGRIKFCRIYLRFLKDSAEFENLEKILYLQL